MNEVLHLHNAAIDLLVTAFGGHVAKKTMGDG